MNLKIEVAQIKEVSINQFLEIVEAKNYKKIETNVYRYNAQIDYVRLDEDEDVSTYIQKTAYLSNNPYTTEDIKKDIFASGIPYQDCSGENVTEVIEKCVVECCINLGAPDVLVCLEPNVWLLAQPNTFGVVQNNDRKSLLCYQLKKNMIIKMDKE